MRRRNIYDGLNFQRIHLNAFVGNNEFEQSPWLDTENALVGIQVNFVVSASFKNQTQVIWVIDPLMRMCWKIIKVGFDNGFNVMKGKIHCPLKGCPSIFQSKGHFIIREGTPRKNESCFMLVFWFYLNFIIFGETIHKRKDFTSHASINNLIYKWHGIVVLKTGFV